MNCLSRLIRRASCYTLALAAPLAVGAAAPNEVAESKPPAVILAADLPGPLFDLRGAKPKPKPKPAPSQFPYQISI